MSKTYEYQILNKNFFNNEFIKQIVHSYKTRKKYNFAIPNTLNKFGEITLIV